MCYYLWFYYYKVSKRELLIVHVNSASCGVKAKRCDSADHMLVFTNFFTQQITHLAFTINNFIEELYIFFHKYCTFFFKLEIYIYILKITSLIVTFVVIWNPPFVCCEFMFYNSMHSMLSNITRIDSEHVASTQKVKRTSRV